MVPVEATDMNPLPPPYMITTSNNQQNLGTEDDDGNCKKRKHRETEKQRRQEMAALFGALRSLLPLEFIRGKRSITDQLNEAVNYIRHLHAEINELEEHKRDKMKKTTNPTCRGSPLGSISSSIIAVFPSCDGVQIMIREVSRESVFPLSVVMELLAKEGVQVFSCSSSRVENGTLYKIHCKVNDGVPVDLTKLRLKLEDVVG